MFSGTSTVAAGGSLTTSRDVLSTEDYQNALTHLCTGSDRNRLALLLDATNFCGILVMHKKDDGTARVTHGALPFYHAGIDQIVGNRSTRPTHNRPGSVSPDITSLYYTIVELNKWEQGSIFLVGTSFKGNKFDFLKSFLDGRKEYVIAAVPVGLGVGWGVDNVVTGELCDELNQFLSLVATWAPSWFQLGAAHDKLWGEAIIANKSALASVLPTLPDGTSPIAAPFYSWGYLDDADYPNPCDRNTKNLEPYLNPSPPLGGTITVGASASAAGADADEVSSMLSSPKKSSSTTKSDADRREGRWILMGSRGSQGTVTTLPFNDEVLEAIRESSKTTAADDLADLLLLKMAEFNESRDRLLHPSNFTAIDSDVIKTNLLYLSGCKKCSTLEAMAAQKDGLTALVLLEDCPVAKQKREKLRANRAIRNLEDRRDEPAAKRSKLDLSVVVVDTITDIKQILVLLSNCVLVCRAVFEYDATKNEDNAPLLHSMAFQFEDSLASIDFRDWYGRLEAYHQVSFLHWMLGTVDSILQKILSLVNHVKKLPKAIKKEYSAIGTELHSEVEDLITAAVEQIDSWVSSKITAVPPSYLFLNSEYYRSHQAQELETTTAVVAARAARTAAASTPRTPRTPAQPSTPHPTPQEVVPSPQPPRTAGEIIVSGGGPIPNLPLSVRQQVRTVCLGHVRDKSVCKNPAGCRYNHPASIADWHPALLDAYCVIVESTPNLSWNKPMIPTNLMAKLKIE